jgi:GNAT superfamily N-acetyltransferase
MTNLKLIRPKPQHVPELARICFEAFSEFHDRHAFPRDIPNLELATRIIGLFVTREDFYGVAAKAGNRLIGSNFLSCTDKVGGVGPLTVDPVYDGCGVGRALMSDVLDYARRNGIEQVRLLQDSFNPKSFSLYASLGFDVRTPVGLMDAKPAPAPDPSVRLVTAADLPDMAEMSHRLYKCSRHGDVALLLGLDLPAFLRVRAGKISGYFIPGFLGHGVAETEADALALVGEAARHVTRELAMFFCPLILGSFYRALLKSGHRLRKSMTYMTLGPFEQPDGIWMPSIGY